MTTDKAPILRALISVSDKTNIVALAKALCAHKVILLSTGGTSKLLQSAGICVQEVSDYTGFPEIMDGRVKTLHPKIHGGLLGRPEDGPLMLEKDIPPIDLLVVNLYPFLQVTQQADCTLDQAIECIDIGGSSMLRSAAKNYARVSVLTDPNDYHAFLKEMNQNGGKISLKTRFMLAKKTFAYTANYDAHISNYLYKQPLNNTPEPFPRVLTVQFHKKQNLRYGENPHQRAALYTRPSTCTANLPGAHQHQGKSLSFNNLIDANAALKCVALFQNTTACVIVKHANPCGVAVSKTQLGAYQRAFATDPTAAFGGIIAFNQSVGPKTAQMILDNQFLEVLIAPAFEAEALSLFAKKTNIRILSCGHLQKTQDSYDYRSITGGMLIQDEDCHVLAPEEVQIVTEKQPSAQQMQDLLFAWQVVRYVKSNAIVYAKDQATLGIGAGQMSRVGSAILAREKAQAAGFNLADSVMASDAFFPFKDSIEIAKQSGVGAIIQPGGSIRDQAVIEAANAAQIAMVFTHIRHFKH